MRGLREWGGAGVVGWIGRAGGAKKAKAEATIDRAGAFHQITLARVANVHEMFMLTP